MGNDFDSISAGDAKGQVAPGWNIPCNEALGDKSHQFLGVGTHPGHAWQERG